MISAIKNIKQFYKLDEAAQQVVLADILKAANNDPDNFKAEIQQTAITWDDDLAIVYEALSKEPDKWSSFFLDELNRIIDLIKSANDIKTPLSRLSDLGFITETHFKHKNDFYNILVRELQNNGLPIVRFHMMLLLADFLHTNFNTVDVIRQQLNDTNWRVRYYAYKILKSEKMLNGSEKLAFTDKLKVLLGNPNKFFAL